MKFFPVVPPRPFVVGFEEKVTITDCARVALEADEQVTFVTEAGGEYDIARKSWGFYATPSTNGRLKRFNLRTALIRNRNNQYFVMLVEAGREPLFEEYLTGQRLTVVCWLDNPEHLARLEQVMSDADAAG